MSATQPVHPEGDGASALPLIEQPIPRRDWLASVDEDILDPDLPIVDPHHHFSNHWGGYMGPEIAADLQSGHAVVATVYVQCGFGYRAGGPPSLAPVGETETALRIAGESHALAPATQICAGIVGYADFQLDEHEVDAVLTAHIEAGQGRFRGIRRSAARHREFRYGVLAPPPWDLYASESFRRGFARLQEFGLSFDALCFHSQLDELTSLAEEFAQTPIVLNHMGAPLGVGPYLGRREAAFAEWRGAMKKLAACGNVHVKLGGMGMATSGIDFASRSQPASSSELAAAWRPYIETSIDLFGMERCMFESNFPVDNAGCSYRTLWNAFKRLAEGATPDEKRALFSENAMRFYRLELD